MESSLVLPWRHEFVETNNIRLHCVTQGQGELVILLHGFLEFWYSWGHQLPALARSFKVVAPDLRGYNDSDKPGQGYDLETLGKDIQGLISALGYERAVIIGHGWGGTLAWHLAQTLPESVRALVLLSAPHPSRALRSLLGNVEHLRQNWYVLAAQVPGLPEWLLRQNLGEFLKDWLGNQSVRKGAFSRQDTDMYQAALSKPGVLSAALNYYRQLVSLPKLWEAVQDNTAPVTMPTLVLWGEQDRIFNASLAQGIEPWVNAPCQFQVLPDCGHWIHREVPQTVNREVLRFLKQWSGPS
jgi:epoxide hydrolase 4